MSDDNNNTISLDNRSLEELHTLKKQQEQQLQSLTQRFAQLRAAAARLHASDRAISEMGSEGNPILVPLTESLYVPGKIRNPDNLLVEIGTGYFVEKSRSDASDFLQRKLSLVDANSENLTSAIQTVRMNLDSLHAAIQGKFLEIHARQEGRRIQSTQEG
jgi:prefoldin alpha subunit